MSTAHVTYAERQRAAYFLRLLRIRSANIGLIAAVVAWMRVEGRRWNAKSFARTILAGTHEIERIPNPAGYNGNWLVLKGTKIGGSEGSWRQWAPGQKGTNPSHPNFGKEIDWKEFTVVITE